MLADHSGGKLKVSVLPAGAVVPAFQMLDAVKANLIPLGWAPLYYFAGKDPAFELLSGVPFALNGDEHRRWRATSEVKAVVQEFLEPHGVVAIPCSGAQMRGEFWSRKRVTSVQDLKGMKIRGAGTQITKIYEGAGITPYVLSAGEIVVALDKGLIDGASYMTPQIDLSLGLHTVAKYYYYPSITRPSETVDLIVNKGTYDSLPPGVQTALWNICALNHERTIVKARQDDNNALQGLRIKNIVNPLPRDIEQALLSSWQRVKSDYTQQSPAYRKLIDLAERGANSSRTSSDK